MRVMVYNYDVIVCVCEDFLMQTDVILRIATPHDAVSIAKIEAQCFTDFWNESMVRAHLDSAISLSIVAELDGEVVGCVLGQVIAPECEVFRVATAPSVRRRGIGEKMLGYFEKTADGEGKSTYFIEVRETNAAARALYNKCGYEEIAVRKSYYKNPRENAIILRKAPRDLC